MTAAGTDPTAMVRSAAVFRRVRTGNAFEETVEHILQAIKLGLVADGERLPSERELAAMLAVSRVTLREAIRVLQQAGYVESRRGRFGGTFVQYRPVKPSRGDLRRVAESMGDGLADALTARRVLESGTAEVAASRTLTALQLDLLRARLHEVTTAPRDVYRQADSRFHLAIAELAGSPTLTEHVADIRMRLNDLLGVIPILDRNIRHSNSQHATIVAAIIGGDPELARAAVIEHVEGTAALLRGFLA
jgi:DNA-binding FadR family transcriptional regulator